MKMQVKNAGAPALRFSRVSQRFQSSDGNSVQALKDVDIDIQEGEFVAVVGPSGCGKSTLLRMAAGTLIPTEGRLLTYGEPILGPRADMAIVFQKPTLLPWLTIHENVTFPARHRHGRVTAAEDIRAEELLELVGLTEFSAKRPNELSGGMQQRAAIARALFCEPSVLLMDEPFSALDALSRDAMSLELLRLLAVRKMTVMFITHSVTEATLLGNKIVVMNARPGSVREIVDVKLPETRTLAAMSSPSFATTADHLRRLLLEPGATAQKVHS